MEQETTQNAITEVEPEVPNTVWPDKVSFKGKLYGVELEIEAEGLYQEDEFYDEESEEYIRTEATPPRGWRIDQEDSIKGIELVSDRPYPFGEAACNIYEAFKDIDRQGYIPMRTPRGSTHVHANVSDLTWKQMQSFVMACVWAEPILIELSGKGRKGNLFAQSYENTPLGWSGIIKWVQQEELFNYVDTHYMAISFHPMPRMGSVEFRMGPSSRNAEEAVSWLMYIDMVVTAGREEEINGFTIPPFVYKLIQELPESRREKILNKCTRLALDFWYELTEPCGKIIEENVPAFSYSNFNWDELAPYLNAMPSSPILTSTFSDFILHTTEADPVTPVPTLPDNGEIL